MTLLEAIAREEGFYVQDTRAQRNNNPGNIQYGKFAIAHHATGTDGRFAIFPSSIKGFCALESLLSIGYRKYTIAEMIAKYAPSNENDTERYIENVCTWTGFDRDKPIIECL